MHDVNTKYSFFAVAAEGTERFLEKELLVFGASEIKVQRAGVSFLGTLEVGYRACLWSFVATRVLLKLNEFTYQKEHLFDDIFAHARAFAWHEHMQVEHTFVTSCSSVIPDINVHYATLKLKDALCDAFMAHINKRPSVDKDFYNIKIHLHIEPERCIIYFDLCGQSLHMRGYRQNATQAPLRETLAAAILYQIKWPTQYLNNPDLALVDLFCGSGTFLIEAALMALDIAPQFLRKHFCLLYWVHHQKDVWNKLQEEITERRRLREIFRNNQELCLLGFDLDSSAIAMAQKNIARAGLSSYIRVGCQDFALFHKNLNYALLVSNLPYGVRVHSDEMMGHLYSRLGAYLKTEKPVDTAYLLVHDKSMASHLHLRATKENSFYNGALNCYLLTYPLRTSTPKHQASELSKDSSFQKTDVAKRQPAYSQPAVMFLNRLQKNIKRLQPWLKKQEKLDCYRVYDADIPEYNAAVDVFGSYILIQEYAAPKEIDEHQAKIRVQDMSRVVQDVFSVKHYQVIVKQRRKQQRFNQYQKTAHEQQFFVVKENQAQFLINLNDYIDCGLFLDHRLIRQKITSLVKNKHFLNLFCYTGSASVCAALGGAQSTTSVDMSATYLDWAYRNFELNRIELKRNPDKHQFIQMDCFAFLSQRPFHLYDVILLDPPTFSNSKRMNDTLDIARDHPFLLEQCLRFLKPQGVIIFSNHLKKFKLDNTLETKLKIKIEDTTAHTIDFDFKKEKHVHHSFLIQRS